MARWRLPDFVRLELCRRRVKVGERSHGEALHLTAAWAVAAIIVSLPKWIAGEQYYAYLGNIWDYFNYTTAGVDFSKLDPAGLSASVAADPAAILRNPMLPWLSQLGARPSIMLVFAVLSHIFILLRFPLFELANAFMSLTLSLYVLSLYLLIRSATSAGPLARLVIPLTFVCGFWGAYLIDVDAWAQLAAVMLMPALFALGLAALAPGPDADATGIVGSLRLGLGMGLLVGGAICLYPELTTVYVPVCGTAMLAAFWTSGRRIRSIITPIVAMGLGLLLALPLSEATFGFALAELQGLGSTPKLSAAWFDHFHAFLLGGEDLSAFTRGAGSLFAKACAYADAAAKFRGALPDRPGHERSFVAPRGLRDRGQRIDRRHGARYPKVTYAARSLAAAGALRRCRDNRGPCARGQPLRRRQGLLLALALHSGPPVAAACRRPVALVAQAAGRGLHIPAGGHLDTAAP